jgi:hypothetical protein
MNLSFTSFGEVIADHPLSEMLAIVPGQQKALDQLSFSCSFAVVPMLELSAWNHTSNRHKQDICS